MSIYLVLVSTLVSSQSVLAFRAPSFIADTRTRCSQVSSSETVSKSIEVGFIGRRQFFVFVASVCLAGSAKAREKPLNDGGKWASHFGEFSEDELSEFQGSSSGLKYKDVVVGFGAEPQQGQTATLHYSGYLLADGSPFDSSYERRRPFSFRVGGGDVIRGWDEAVRTMRVGGRRMILIPPALGYGAAGAGGGRIPGGADLVFFLELLSVGP